MALPVSSWWWLGAAAGLLHLLSLSGYFPTTWKLRSSRVSATAELRGKARPKLVSTVSVQLLAWPNGSGRPSAGRGVTGRLYVCISRNLSASAPEPRLEVHNGHGDPSGSFGQVFGMDVEDWTQGRTLVLDLDQADGFPVRQWRDLPPSPWRARVQAVFVIYEEYKRARGPPVFLPRWDSFIYSGDADDFGWTSGGPSFGNRMILDSAGLVASKALQVDFSKRAVSLDFKLDQPGASAPARPRDTDYAKYFSIRSSRLSSFWGRDVHLGAWVLLPAGWHDHPESRYPLLINHGHYSYQSWRGWADEAPRGTVRPPAPTPDADPDDCFFQALDLSRSCIPSDPFEQLQAFYFQRNWTTLGDPSSAFHGRRVLLVRLQHQNPFFDDSYAVNSENIGPYGDAITYELLPALEERFHGLGPWARGMYGGSTGGWEALAAQIFYPSEYNGAVGNAPDPVDFHALGVFDIYAPNANAFGRSVSAWGNGPPVPAMRDYKGRVLQTLESGSAFEAAVASRGRSGGQNDAWQAVFSPMGADGYPMPLWDKQTGAVDAQVAQKWRDTFDIGAYLEKHWQRLGPTLRGKLHFFVGSMDNFYLNVPVFRLQSRLDKCCSDPPHDSEFRYGTFRGRGYGHAWSGLNGSALSIVDSTLHARMVTLLTDHMLRTAPADADISSWRY